MPAPSRRLKANLYVNNIPPGVYKIRHYWKILVRHLKYYMTFDRRSFWEGILAGLLKAPLGVLTIYLSGLFVDSIVAYYQTGELLRLGSIAVPIPIIYIVAIFVISRIQRILDGVGHIAQTRLRNNAFVEYRRNVAEKFHKLNSQEIDREQVKDLITKVETFWQGNAISFYGRLAGVTQYVVSIILSLIALFSVSPWIAVLVLLVPIPEIIVVFKHYRKHADYVDDIAPLMLERNYYFSALTDPRTFPERKINGVFRALIERYNHVATLVSEGYKRVLTEGEKKIVQINLFGNVMLVLLKSYVLVSSFIEKVAVGHITAMIGYIDSLYRNSYDLQNNLISMFDELTFIDYLYEFQDISGFADERKKGKHLKKGSPSIELEHASFRYPDNGREILEDVSLSIKHGEKVMILGKDGTGKSSLLALLAGMYELSSGVIKLDKVPIPKLARGQIKIKMSVVPEDFARYYMTLRENIILGDPKKEFDEKLYKQALAITGLDVWAKENNIDDQQSILGNYFEGGVSISSGHWQRIAIARAIYRNKEIFLLDQPFTYIDSHSVHEIFPRLMKFIGKRTLIYISEHTTYAKDMTKTYELVDKKLVEHKRTLSGRWGKNG